MRMSVYLLFVQSLALVAVSFFVVSFHAKTRIKILVLQLVGLVIWVTHFVLLSAYTGAALLLVNALITLVLIFKKNIPPSARRIVLSASLGMLAIVTFITWEGFYSFFALLAVSAITIAKWQDIPQRLRVIAVFASLFWIVYDVFVSSYGGILAECLTLISILTSLLGKRKF